MLSTLRQLVTILCLFSIISVSSAVENPYRVFYEKADFIDRIDYLRHEYGKHKVIPEEIELEALIALSNYPELKDVKIEFIFRNQSAIMLMRPKSHITLKKKEDRIFRIFMTSNKDQCRGVTLDEVPFNALIGVFAHELAHVLDFREKSSLEYVTENIKYTFSKKYRAQLERETDIVTVNHGLGYQLCHVRDVLADCEFMPRNPKGKSLSAYLTSEEILNMISEQEKKFVLPENQTTPVY
jgi:hypothetical protein